MKNFKATSEIILTEVCQAELIQFLGIATMTRKKNIFIYDRILLQLQFHITNKCNNVEFYISHSWISIG